MPQVLITGANRGIGLALVQEYCQQQWQIIATCRHPEQAQAFNWRKRTVTSALRR
nr:SDR family NAD(P)-dependent oxidoreductase [Pseudoalteromonas ruthenica]